VPSSVVPQKEMLSVAVRAVRGGCPVVTAVLIVSIFAGFIERTVCLQRQRRRSAATAWSREMRSATAAGKTNATSSAVIRRQHPRHRCHRHHHHHQQQQQQQQQGNLVLVVEVPSAGLLTLP